MSAYYVIGQNASGIAVRIDRAPRPITEPQERFSRHIRTVIGDLPTPCRIWTGSEAFNMGDGRTVTPKRAAVEMADMDLPHYRRIPMLCETPGCIALSHMDFKT